MQNRVAVAGGAALTVKGTAGNDNLSYTPTGATAGTVALAGLNAAFNVSNVSAAAGAFTLDALGGTDKAPAMHRPCGLAAMRARRHAGSSPCGHAAVRANHVEGCHCAPDVENPPVASGRF